MSNWESWGAEAVDLDGNETFPLNHRGASAYSTIDKIKAFMSAAFDAAGTAATVLASHLSAYTHGDIHHDNRSLLDSYSGPQDLSGFASISSVNAKADKANPTTTGTWTHNGDALTASITELNRLVGLAENINMALSRKVDTYYNGVNNSFSGDNSGMYVQASDGAVTSAQVQCLTDGTVKLVGTNGVNVGTAGYPIAFRVNGILFSRSQYINNTSTFILNDYSDLIANYNAGTMTITLPAASSYHNRVINVRTIQNQAVVSASSNVVPLAGGAAGTAILAATAGKWAMLQSDGAVWQIMMAN